MNTATFNAGLAWSEYKRLKIAYAIAACVAFLMSSYFVVGYLAGSLNMYAWGASEWFNALAGIGITGVMTAYQFFLYSRGDISGGRKATILALCVAVGFSLLSEVGQGMERDHIRMEVKSVESPTYQALIGKLGQAEGTTGHPFTHRLSQAEMKLARCREHVASGRWKDCIESTARLNSIQGQIAQFYQQQQSQALALTDKAKQLEKDESNYHPLVNLVRSVSGATAAIASFLVSLTLISFFEYAFHYLGRQFAHSRSALLDAGYDVTNKTRKTPTLLQRTDTPLDPTRKVGTGEPYDLTRKVEPTLESHFKEWARAVEEGALSPTITPAKRWISERDLVQGIKPIQNLAVQWLERLEQQGTIHKNPQGGVGKPKYILGGAA